MLSQSAGQGAAMETRSSIVRENITLIARRYSVLLAAHWIRVTGELLNFAGAVVLAADLFLRQKRNPEAKFLDPFGEWGRKQGLTAIHHDVSVSDVDFTVKVLDRGARRLGYWGIGPKSKSSLADPLLP